MDRIPCPADTEATVGDLAVALRAGATLIDVREPGEYTHGHVPGARLIPMGQLPGRVTELDSREPVYVICATGNRSSAVTAFLVTAGFRAYNVAGGTNAWVRAGSPVRTGIRA
jgi:rhodanese-related sulfurtransferase